eukprot:gnl/Spiro4/24429_TR12112_c0_g1_i1.p1 gnl/Spiro4/24429_TR12112_c0_g1~~gnl/Spiro4/24429_TR12112_c0_g1_i1.p1  ORF type:complete len:452 (-),score=144.86 gnl/Spiro4/24429_TR12112_c0_g1_i1:163-1518(-)
MMAAGRSIEPFWGLYAQHHVASVYKILESHRVANLVLTQQERDEAAQALANDPYAQDPARSPLLHVVSQKPFCAEPPLELLVDQFHTPESLFFVRNHLPVPAGPTAASDPAHFRLSVFVPGREDPVQLSLEDLKTKFHPVTITAVLQCAGNRRSELQQHKEIKGLAWNAGAIGNGEWTGVRLRDVLLYSGFTEEQLRSAGVRHVQFEGMDSPYGASIPLDKAVAADGDVILAYDMNGQPLSRDHGFPLRALVPGVVAARSVKWLATIRASDAESPAHWQQKDYKSFNPGVDWDSVDFTTVPAIQELPVQSAICEPADGHILDDDETSLAVRGYAWSGGGRGIVRVDITLDDGKTWTDGKLVDVGSAADQSPSPYSRQWGWTRFEADATIPEELRGHDFRACCRAVDASHNIQPENSKPLWNLRGVLANSWHCVSVKRRAAHVPAPATSGTV